MEAERRVESLGESWSGVRVRLEKDLLCEKLRGRIQYFLTHYHGAPDQYGRFCVRLDGKEIIFANPYHDMAASRAAGPGAVWVRVR